MNKILQRLTTKRENDNSYTEFTFGEQDVIDLISFESLEEHPSYYDIDGTLHRFLFIANYPYIAVAGWFDQLVNVNQNMDISFHVEVVDNYKSISKLHKKITQIESQRRTNLEHGRIVGAEITEPLESAEDLRLKIIRGQEKLFQVGVYIDIQAKNIEELDNITSEIKSILASKLFICNVAKFQQYEGLQSSLPRSEDCINQKRNLDSTTTSLSFPFSSSELVHDNGILYGINKNNKSLVIIDRFSLNNANSITFAQSGSGKSYSSKVEILRQLNQGTRVIIIDPEREYQQLSQSVNGTYIKISSNSKEKINPFDFEVNSHSDSEKSQHIQELIGIITLMVGELDINESATLDRVLTKLYKKQTKSMPLLINVYNLLQDQGEYDLCKKLEKYITGSLKNLFDEQTNIDMNNRLIVFDIKDAPENTKNIMLFIIANFVQNKVKKDKHRKLLVIDEGWLLLQHEESAKFIAGLVRRARKYYLGVSIITQEANDFLSNNYGRAIASQSSMRILLRQDTTTIKNVVNHFDLSDYESKFLLSCDRGDAIVIADKTHVSLNITASRSEHPIITTNPLELDEYAEHRI